MLFFSRQTVGARSMVERKSPDHQIRSQIMIKCERMWKFQQPVGLKQPSFKDSVTVTGLIEFLRRRCNGAKIIYRIRGFIIFSKIITGSGTFVSCEGIPVRILEVSEARFDISNDKRSEKLFAEIRVSAQVNPRRVSRHLRRGRKP